MRGREGSRASTTFRIVVKGEFGDLLQSAFRDVPVTTGVGRTVLTAEVRDEQELYGIMDRLRDLGVHIAEVNELPKQAEAGE